MTTLEDYLGPLAAKLPKPNYVDPETRVPILLGIEVSITVLMILFLFARFYTRIIVTRTQGWDDVAMGLAAAIAITQAIVLCLGTKYGLAYHLWDIKPQNIPIVFKMIGTGVLLIYPAAALCRISVCMGYMRLFPTTKNWWFCRIMMIYSGVWGVGAFFAGLLICRPVTLSWNHPFSPKRKCINMSAALIAIAALNSLGDILVFLWPATVLFKLQIPLRRRLGLITLFCVGWCIVAISVCRMVWLLPISKKIDIPYSQSRNLIASSVENNLGIICGCLPTIKAFLTHFFPRLFGTTTRRSTSGERGGNVYHRQGSSFRRHCRNGSRIDPEFNMSYLSRKVSDGYKLQAIDSSYDMDKRRLVADVQVVPFSEIVKTQKFTVRSLPSDQRDSMAEASLSTHAKTAVGCNAEDDSVDSGGSC